MYLFGLLLSIFGLMTGITFVAFIGAAMFLVAIATPDHQECEPYRTSLKND